MEQQIALVTGGSRGIGAQICYELAAQNVTVLFTYINSTVEAGKVLSQLQRINGNLHHAAFQCNMANEVMVAKLFAEINTQFGNISILVNNAGITGSGKLFALTGSKEWNRVFLNNLDSVLHTCRNVLPFMMRKKQGTIINITSISAHIGTSGSSAYSASKAAIITLTKTLFREVGCCGINTFAVSPGMIDTDMVKDASKLLEKRRDTSPLKRIGTPQEVANLVRYLALEAPAYLGGQEICIDGLQF